MKLRDCLLCSACGCFTFPTWKRVIPGSVKFSDLHKKYGRDSPISPLDPDINPNGNHRTQSTSSWCNDTAIETTGKKRYNTTLACNKCKSASRRYCSSSPLLFLTLPSQYWLCLITLLSPALTLPNQRAQAPASPCCVRLCHQVMYSNVCIGTLYSLARSWTFLLFFTFFHFLQSALYIYYIYYIKII